MIDLNSLKKLVREKMVRSETGEKSCLENYGKNA